MQQAEKTQNQKQGCKIIRDDTSSTEREFEAQCTISGTVAHIKRTVTFSGDSAAHSEVTNSYPPALRGINSMTVVMDQKYIGACPAGMNPGDFRNSDGTITKRPGN